MIKEIIKAQLIAQTIYDAHNTSMNGKECAEFLGVSYTTVKIWIDNEKIKSTYHNGVNSIPKIQFLDKIIDDFIEKSEKEDKKLPFQIDVKKEVKQVFMDFFKNVG